LVALYVIGFLDGTGAHAYFINAAGRPRTEPTADGPAAEVEDA
jgi:hypothetical protein